MTEIDRLEFGILTSRIGSLDVALAADIDFIWLDAEHTGLTTRDIADVVARARGRGVDVLVRVQDCAENELIALANTGIDELILPRIRSVDEIDAAWQAISYPPTGRRPRQMTTSSRYGREWKGAPRLSVIIETVDAARICSEIADDDRLFGIWSGPRDLVDDCQRAGLSEVETQEVLTGVQSAMRAGHARWGLGASNEEELEKIVALGAPRCVLYWEPYQRARLEALSHSVARSRKL